MTEAEFQGRVLKRLRATGGYWVNIHGGAYQRPGLPDVLGCYKGWFISIELKRPGKYATPQQGMTPAQWNFLSQVRANGGIAIVADTEDAIFNTLKEIEEHGPA